ncbi:hypothetical protein [Paraburkholderia sp. SIMBA_054]|uniref:hypothetical protein n=1 Tax=Paraburkholderia sp. SIMBA_054 TaxID=3085795 RepID=UPI003977E725
MIGVKADPTTTATAGLYIDPRIGGRRADVGLSTDVDSYLGDVSVRRAIHRAMRGIRAGDRSTQLARAKRGLVVDLKRLGMRVYLDDSGPLVHLTMHGAFGTVAGGLQAYSYSYRIGEPRFRVQRWLHVTAGALATCLKRNKAKTLEHVRHELCILIASVAPVGNLALAQGWPKVGIPTSHGLFAGGFAPGEGLRLDDYLWMEGATRDAEQWFLFHSGFPLEAGDALIRSVEEAQLYREDRLMPWLGEEGEDLWIFVPGSGGHRVLAGAMKHASSWKVFEAPFEEHEFVDDAWLRDDAGIEDNDDNVLAAEEINGQTADVTSLGGAAGFERERDAAL